VLETQHFTVNPLSIQDLSGRPPGAAARIEHTPEGMQITLRPHGVARWGAVAFLSFWLMGWAAGELFAIAALLSMAGWRQGAWSPVGGFDLAGGGFLLVWLTFWTVGGIAALLQVLRLGWGADVLTLGTDAWEIRRGVGPWGKTRRVHPTDIRRVTLRRREGDVAAETSAGTVVLTAFGEEPEKRWLRDLLCRALGQEPEAGRGPEVIQPEPFSSPPPAPQGWVSDFAPDGGARLRTSTGSRAATAAGCLFFCLFWNGIVGLFVALGLGLFHAEYEGPSAMGPGTWGYWLFLTPFIAVGLGLFAAFIWTAFGQEEWHARKDRLEIRRRLFLWNRDSSYESGVLALEAGTDSDGDQTYTLVLENGPTKEKLQGPASVETLRALGVFLSYHTGWPFYER
jgi:hypothetical protein